MAKTLAEQVLRQLHVYVFTGYFRGLHRIERQAIIDVEMPVRQNNSHLPECWLHYLVGPRRYRAVLPSNRRPNLFGGD